MALSALQQFQTYDDQDEMPIEQYLLKMDPYRCSTANPVFPVPLKLDVPDHGVAYELRNDSHVEGFILQHLAEYDIKQLNFGFYNVSQPFYPNGGNVPVPTLIINVDLGGDNTTLYWPEASQYLHNRISESGYPGVCVEIRDCDRYFQPSLFPLLPEDEAVVKYEAHKKDLIEIIRENLKNTWSMMSVFKIGRDSAKAVTAIVVMVQPLANQNWRAIKEQIGEKTRLEIKFAIGSCQPIQPPVAPPNLHPGILTAAQGVEPPSSAAASIRKLLASSGNAINWTWGDLDLRSDQILESPDRNLIPLVPSENTYKYVKVGSLGTGGGDHVFELSEMKKGDWCLNSQTPNVTAGICHGAEVYCNHTRYDKTNVQSTLVDVDYTEELVVILIRKFVWVGKPGVWNSRSECSGESIDEQNDFCQSRDSGSWFIGSIQDLSRHLEALLTNPCDPFNIN
ncbi:hypothetical protein MMC31_007742 [Peltigera leucophlebia]|nr:hypothetical protein [Peltigera leucophlebia]